MMKKYKLYLLGLLLIIPCAIIIGCYSGNNLKNFEGIALTSVTYDYDGTEKVLEIVGTLPEGANVSYTNNKAINSGIYNVIAEISCEGYNTLKLQATLTINKLNYDMTNVKWNYNNAFTYDGQEKVVEVINLPEGVSVSSYSNNRKTNAGSYTASVTFNYDTLNHNKPNLQNCNWLINKVDILGIKFENKKVVYDSNVHTLLIDGVLPEGVMVKYTNNSASEIGKYNATATLSGQNYNTLVLTATLNITPNLSQLATNVVTSLMKVPDIWEFLPTSFRLENKAYVGNLNIDFTNFVNTRTLPQVGIGKQMNVVYSTLLDVESVLVYVNQMYGYINTMVDFYQTFINNNPENYATYEKVTDNFTFKIMLDDNDYNLYIRYKVASIELRYSIDNKNCYGRVQLTNSNVIKYEMSNNEITIATNIVGVALTKLHFKRENNIINGYLYEYYGTESTSLIKTSALIKIDDKYVTIISDKRETDDLKIEGYMEVYDKATAKLLACEVNEKGATKNNYYDTKWFNIWDIQGINSIKVIDEQNVLNADTIYINGKSDTIHTMWYSYLDQSRRFDIEMKVLYFYQYNEEKDKYEKVKIELPMLFVQKDKLSSFSKDFKEKNKIDVKINLSDAVNAYFNKEYGELINDYLILKQNLTYENIINYIGNKNQYFN
ncbi:MAG: hypothetical protein MR904_03800 [Clostridia bacterium]|nr:hypothetical protein [Clostridia bacterium]